MKKILFRILAALLGLGGLVAGIDLMFYHGNRIKASEFSMAFVGVLLLFFAATGAGLTGENAWVKKVSWETRNVVELVIATAVSFCFSIIIIMNPDDNSSIAGLIVVLTFLIRGYECFYKLRYYITFFAFFVIPFAVAVIHVVYYRIFIFW